MMSDFMYYVSQFCARVDGNTELANTVFSGLLIFGLFFVARLLRSFAVIVRFVGRAFRN